MRPIKTAVVLILMVATSGVRAADNSQALIEHPARNSSRDSKVPRALVHQLEVEYRKFLKQNEVSPKEDIKRRLLNLSAELTQKKPVALHENTRIVTPLGGGVVDLSEYVTPLRGTFSLKILARNEDGSEPAGLRVFFVSNAKTRTVGGDKYGAGCGKFMEITSYFYKQSRRSGFPLYTADQRYLSVVGGTFVAVDFERDALQVGSMTFLDSRYPELLCE